jgi:mevalonate kinase
MPGNSITARAPGKIILSGEHAVVHGRPALALAVDRFARADTAGRPDRAFRIQAPALAVDQSFSRAALAEAGRELTGRYEQFLAGALDIRQVVRSPAELFAFALDLLLSRFFLNPRQGLTFELSTDIPTGCGMGSSAAVAAAFLAAAARALELPMDTHRLYEYTLEAEKLLHGKPSGADPYVCVHGGLVRFRQGKAEHSAAAPAAPLALVHTGVPESTTGECVMQVSRQFGAGAVWDEFAAVTDGLERALRDQDSASLLEKIRENHRLLARIGVVPERVQQFIRAVEQQGGAAKVCGAGSIRGDRAGVVWVAGAVAVEELGRAFGYEAFRVRGVDGGVGG